VIRPPKAVSKRRKASISVYKGKSFEAKVERILSSASKASNGALAYKPKPKITLHGGGTKEPDFRLTIKLPHETRHIFVECQDRRRSTGAIVEKIQFIRAKHKAKTFMFLYPKCIPAPLTKKLEREGIVPRNLLEFEAYINDSVVSALASKTALHFATKSTMLRSRVTFNGRLSSEETECLLAETEISETNAQRSEGSNGRLAFG